VLGGKMKERLRQALQPVLQNQTLYQLNQMKSFIDSSLKDVASKNFENDADKIKYLLNALYDIRDFVLNQTHENSVRLNLIQQFDKIEEEEILGNSQLQQEENSLLQTEEKLEQDPKDLKIEKEVTVEDTPDR
tara:strand:+ start:60 stop:458 length:399 start_codon:yes stop_codon:yes gene_type:complete